MHSFDAGPHMSLSLAEVLPSLLLLLHQWAGVKVRHLSGRGKRQWSRKITEETHSDSKGPLVVKNVVNPEVE